MVKLSPPVMVSVVDFHTDSAVGLHTRNSGPTFKVGRGYLQQLKTTKEESVQAH